MTSGPTDPSASDSQLTDQAREGLCRRCGASCHVAVPAGDLGSVVVPGLHCQFLVGDGDRFACSVYERRFEAAPWCHTAQEAQPLGYLANDCPYGAHPEGKVVLAQQDLDRTFPAILRNLRAWGVPTYIDRTALLAQLESRTRRRWALDPWPGDPERLRVRPVGFSQPMPMIAPKAP